MDIQATIEVYIELLSPLKPYINMHILRTVHCAFPVVLTRRIRLTIKNVLSLYRFHYSRDLNVRFRGNTVRRIQMLILGCKGFVYGNFISLPIQGKHNCMRRTKSIRSMPKPFRCISNCGDNVRSQELKNLCASKYPFQCAMPGTRNAG